MMSLLVTEMAKSMERGWQAGVGVSDDHKFGFRYVEFVMPFKISKWRYQIGTSVNEFGGQERDLDINLEVAGSI